MERTSRTLIQFQRYLFTKHQSITKNHNLKSASMGTSNNTNSICWKCGTKKSNASDIFCEKCHTIQSPNQKNNYFKVLGIREDFNIDQRHLKEKYREFQNSLHPDKFSNSTHEEQTISEEYSSLINKAYSNLISPMKRAEHLLQLKGGTVEESQTIDDPAFLMQIMMLNEEVEEAEQDVEKLKKLDEDNKEKLQKLVKEIDTHFRNSDIEAAKKTVIKLKYFMSINTRINSIFREAGITD